jgi:phosphatidylethanolamine/phosphatidyl-N-methylethanolamine N-methyltransferase
MSSDSGLHTYVEEAIAPLMKAVGWSSAFRTSRILQWAMARGDMEVLGVDSLFPAGFFKIVRLRKRL